MDELIINCPRFGTHKYLINNKVAIHVAEKTIEDILKYYHPEAIIDITTIF